MNGPHLPTWAHELLASCPNAGAGVHRWLFRAAVRFHTLNLDPEQIFALLRRGSEGCGRVVEDKEIEDAISNSSHYADGEIEGHKPRPRWPAPNQYRIEQVVSAGPGLKDLQDASEMRWSDDSPHTEDVVDRLFPGNPLICAGRAKERALTRSRNEWRGFLSKQQFIVPSPMSAIQGKTQSGKTSMRTLANTGPRGFLVVEFDQGHFDQHAAILYHLSQHAPLVLVVHSGNRSLHGWFYCGGQPEDKVEKFFRYAVSLGADPATWTRCQWVRNPDGQRENGKRQSVIFFSPKAITAL